MNSDLKCKIFNHENRVLGRLGAREMSLRELDSVAGANFAHTETVCTFNPITHSADGDTFLGEC